MAQLNAETASKVEAAEDGFKLLDPHIAILQLIADVEVKQGAKGDYWQWDFQTVEGSEIGSGRKWKYRTSLSDAAFFKLKELFLAFGVPTSTNTDELVGKKVRAEIVVKTIGGDSARAGELTNEIKSLLPLDGPTGKTGDAPVQIAKVPGAVADGKGGSTDDPLF